MQEDPMATAVFTPNFSTWPLDLLVDYLKKYHGRKDGQLIPETRHLLEVVTRVHGGSHPELMDVLNSFLVVARKYKRNEDKNLYEALAHVATQLTELLIGAKSIDESQYEALKQKLTDQVVQMQTIQKEVAESFHSIAELTKNYKPPLDACQSYRRVLDFLKTLDEGFQEQSYLISDVLTPQLQG